MSTYKEKLDDLYTKAVEAKDLMLAVEIAEKIHSFEKYDDTSKQDE